MFPGFSASLNTHISRMYYQNEKFEKINGISKRIKEKEIRVLAVVDHLPKATGLIPLASCLLLTVFINNSTLPSYTLHNLS
jgi:hypothetical protein